MQSDAYSNLIELLKSQVILYKEVYSILVFEREAVVSWQVKETAKYNADKERLTRKERILEEARITLAQRIQKEFNLPDATLSSIISASVDNDKRLMLIQLKEQLLEVTALIHQESVALKMLYSTNLKLINEMYAQMGYLSTDKYGSSPSAHMPGTISALG